ncbi:MAG: bifunctional metallophosphatase/5'-nucleotidase [candidate division KSB1 bacterium]|nr:bifunctional metallophosphatase/5'-nucleotidase [candidate division KSB1 bacterium]MDZ7272960.1 bifunctional metallophosphatase/5'-nucleotidase [candidate division KSB1 bacterium]MDZ7285064.1 bifunctional metallophosphatase/5'-nucleotidase [candidate division KSB1 bacterium]MDZ7298096.1 bifunctional metallophosphatase/5'-nucleotidase [candidate division KSB1 bacterium]MDZ7308227.1 bifunctional metallophosphatase/5'-nucleotidase [candidate division KSB1 bacterium]
MWKRLFRREWLPALLVALSACAGPANLARREAGAAITLLQINDLYELTPVSGGKEGGLARLATLRRQLQQHNPNTFMILAGDLLSPSALGTAVVEGERLAGRQMVAVLNAIGLDFCTFGNHEFDLKEEAFRKRLAESRFTWFSSNVFDRDGRPFPGVAENVRFTVVTAAQQHVRVGLFGVTMTKNKPDYVSFSDPLATARQQVARLRGQVDILIAVTHLPLEDDLALAQALPEIDLILGGHEHENVQVWRGPDFTPVFKADANVRSVYVHELHYDPAARQVRINSRLQPITDRIAEDPAARVEVQKWVAVAFAAFRQMGFAPEKLVVNSPVELDGREAVVRNHPGLLTDLIAASFLRAAPEAELALFNGGSIRIDDVLPAGPITEYDIIRLLPFGGNLALVEMTGELLARVLEQGRKNKGSGGYLHTANVSWDEGRGRWRIKGNELDPGHRYKVASSDFLISGNEQGLDYLQRSNPGLTVLNEKVAEIRRAFILHLQETYGTR